MVKINLLAEGKRPLVARKAKQPFLSLTDANRANWIAGALSVLGVLVAVAWAFVLSGRIDAKQREINVAQREVDELQQVIKEVQQYEEKLKELNRKVEVITTLKDNQRGPVVIMDEVSKALPDLLWLTNLDVSATNLNFRGRAFNMSAVANFIDNLDRVEQFREPVLQDTTRARGRGTGGELYDFRLTLAYSMKAPAPAPASGPAGAAAASGGAVASAEAAQAAAAAAGKVD